LLEEATQRLRAQSPPAWVLQVDLKLLKASADLPETATEAVIRALVDQSAGQLDVEWQSAEYAAGQVIAQLVDLSRQTPVVLMFDTTEQFQEDMAFWRWMEENLVGPFVGEERVRQVFAGRIPAPWRGFEVRRVVKLLQLTPLCPQDDARNLVREALRQTNVSWESESEIDRAADLVIEFSFGHPLLSEELAAYVAQHGSGQSDDALKSKLAGEVVKPFIAQHFFDQVESPWDEILEWASVLDWFDATILPRYLRRVAPELITDPTSGKEYPDYFFIQGIHRLRIQKTIVWREERGDRLHGVIGDIVRRCFEVREWEKYRAACQAATETLESLAGEFLAESPESRQYHREAEAYRLRAKKEEER